MKTAGIVFRKELKDAIRDRRTLMAMVVVPLLLFPLLISIASKFMGKAIREARERTLTVALVHNDNGAGLVQLLSQNAAIDLRVDLALDEGHRLVRADSLDGLIEIAGNFDETIADGRAGSVTFYYKETDETRIERRRLRRLLGEYEQQLREERFEAMGVDPGIMETLEVAERNVASMKERIAGEVGGFLPYLFIIFCFTGSMYVAIDVAAGEKERGTLETLLTAPADRFSILLGKFGVVVLSGLLAAAMSMLGVYVGIRTSNEIPDELLSVLVSIIEPQTIVVLLSMLLPLTIFFGAILLSLSLFARTYKEAQSLITPLMVVVIVPAFMGMLPGVKLTAVTAAIPIVNVALATKSVLAGRIDALLLAEMYVSLTVIAVASILACSRLFERESTVFRGI